jgi:hypothetical protein
MRGTGNHHIRLISGKFFVVIRQGDRDVKVFAGDNIANARIVRDDVLRELRPTTAMVPEPKPEPETNTMPGLPRLERRREDYYAAGCVLLLAATHMTREAYEWASDMLDVARAVDALREERK